MRTRVSPALVVACFALAVALGGAGYAAVTLPKNSVGTAQLKKNAVTGPKVKNKSLGRADINQSSLAFGKSISLSGLDFASRNSTIPVLDSAGTGCIEKTAGAEYLSARVSLPQGAKVRKVVFYVIDSAAGNMSLAFTRFSAAAGGASDLRFGMTSGTALGVRAFSFTGSPITVVNNTKYSYRLQVLMLNTTSHALCGGRVEYTLP